MKWVKDNTGRFPERPHYDQNEIDTDDITVMIESAGADLDLYADLSSYGANVEGVAEFSYGKKPLVQISCLLSENPKMKNRFRTTLTHECGHVKFHRFLWEMKATNRSLFPCVGNTAQICMREKILTTGAYDWMEWQASYSCGAFLMPISNLCSTSRGFMLRQGTGPFSIDQVTQEAEALIQCVMRTYEVSRDAARVRLIQVSLLSSGEKGLQTPLWG